MARRERLRSEAWPGSYVVDHPHALQSPRSPEVSPGFPQRGGCRPRRAGRRARAHEPRPRSDPGRARRARYRSAPGHRALVLRGPVVHRDRRQDRDPGRYREVADRRRARAPAHGDRRKGAVVSDVRELLPLYVLGALEADETEQVLRAVAADPQLASELAELENTAYALI